MNTHDKSLNIKARCDELLDRLLDVGPIDMRVALVVAHPDDETIAMAGMMARFTHLTLVHMTDGAPAAPDVSRQSRDAMSALRREEISGALSAALAHPSRRLAYGFTDGQLAEAAVDVADRVARDLASADILMTHPFEGGHIDHDVCALAVQAACREIAARGLQPPDRMEFASYHGKRGRVVADAFWPDDDCREVQIELTPAARQRRTAAFACHRSQEKNLRFFSLATERFRLAPFYDFDGVPPPGRTLYDEDAGRRFARAVETLRDRPVQA